MTEKCAVLIKVRTGKDNEVLESIAKSKQVKLAWVVQGPYDLLVIVEGKNLEEIGALITGSIRGHPDVLDTISMTRVSEVPAEKDS